MWHNNLVIHNRGEKREFMTILDDINRLLDGSLGDIELVAGRIDIFKKLADLDNIEGMVAAQKLKIEWG